MAYQRAVRQAVTMWQHVCGLLIIRKAVGKMQKHLCMALLKGTTPAASVHMRVVAAESFVSIADSALIRAESALVP